MIKAGAFMGQRPVPKRIEVVDPEIAAILKEKTIAERVEMIFAANRTMRLLIAGRLKTDHPDWSEVQIQAEVSRRMLEAAFDQ